jgi:hypothetical protein
MALRLCGAASTAWVLRQSLTQGQEAGSCPDLLEEQLHVLVLKCCVVRNASTSGWSKLSMNVFLHRTPIPAVTGEPGLAACVNDVLCDCRPPVGRGDVARRVGCGGLATSSRCSALLQKQQPELAPDGEGGPPDACVSQAISGSSRSRLWMAMDGWTPVRAVLKAWGPANQSAWGLTSRSTTRASNTNDPTGMHTTARAL